MMHKAMPMRMTVELDVEVDFDFRPGSPDTVCRGEACPGSAPEVTRVLSIRDAKTGLELVGCIDSPTTDGIIELVQDEFEAMEARRHEGY